MYRVQDGQILILYKRDACSRSLVKLLPDQWTSEQFDKVDWDLLNTTLAKKKNMYTLWSPEPKISENGPEPEF